MRLQVAAAPTAAVAEAAAEPQRAADPRAGGVGAGPLAIARGARLRQHLRAAQAHRGAERRHQRDPPRPFHHRPTSCRVSPSPATAGLPRSATADVVSPLSRSGRHVATLHAITFRRRGEDCAEGPSPRHGRSNGFKPHGKSCATTANMRARPHVSGGREVAWGRWKLVVEGPHPDQRTAQGLLDCRLDCIKLS